MVGGIQLDPLGTAATDWAAPGDYDDGEFGGMKIGRGNRSTRGKPAPAPLCPPQIPLDQTRARTRAAAVGSQRLTAWAMARTKREQGGTRIPLEVRREEKRNLWNGLREETSRRNRTGTVVIEFLSVAAVFNLIWISERSYMCYEYVYPKNLMLRGHIFMCCNEIQTQ
jgi:hypothetical protein